MRILVTGNLGYIGPTLGRRIKGFYQNSDLIGVDTGLFLQCITTKGRLGDTYFDKQKFIDIRDIRPKDLIDIDAVVSLAAVSNDPIGRDFEKATKEINFDANLRLASICSDAGVGKFIFASSCSMYGEAGEYPKTEADLTYPLTAYARSKIGVENTLRKSIFNKDIKLIFLRFATACGPSDRLRLDLVLNDLVASAIKYKKISILSDGTPWRPLIDVDDIANAIVWAIEHKFKDNEPLSINVGSNEWNFRVADLADLVAQCISGTSIEINQEAPEDKRSYKVDFSLYKSLSGNFYPKQNINTSIDKLAKLIYQINLPETSFRETYYIRLNHIKSLLSGNIIDNNLRWL